MAIERPIFLKKHADYQRVYREGRKGRATLFAWFVAPQSLAMHADSLPPVMRIGLTVPKVLGHAVDRNRIKRRMRAAIRKQPPELLAAPLDLVLHPRRTVLDCDFARLLRDVEKVLREAALLAVNSPVAASAGSPAKVPS